MDIKAEIYPAFNLYYYSFYLQGIFNLLGSRAVRFKVNSFPDFHQNCLAFIFLPLNLKVYIDAEDCTDIDNQGLLWCDVYAKVNINTNKVTNNFLSKIIPIGPSFGIKFWTFPKACLNAILNYLYCLNSNINLLNHFKFYLWQLKYRVPLSEYVPKLSNPNYIFSLSSIWAPDDNCNKYRSLFYEVCHSIKWLHFEGGFVPPFRNDVSGLEQYSINRRYPVHEYISKLKRSALAFNTPAVLDCHGWKLGEFLALGKAIISNPLTRKLPYPLKHGENIHFVNGSKNSIKEAINYICTDDRYRKHLENNSRMYFLKYLQPQFVIKRILDFKHNRQI